MTALFFILIILVSIVLAFFVLIQNPEGGGLSGSIGGFSNQIMGVKKTNNVLERGTWLLVIILGVMSLFSVIMFTGGSSVKDNALKQLNTTAPITQPQQPATIPSAPAK